MIRKITDFIKQHKKIVISFTFIVLAISGIAIRVITPKNTNNTSNRLQVPYKNSIKPGTTKTSDLLTKMGPPISTVSWSDKNNTNILNYKSDTKWNTQFFTNTDSSVVELVIQQHSTNDTYSITQATAQFTESPILLFSSKLGNNYYLQLYPKRGIGFVAPYQTGTVFQTLYFAPVTDSKAFLESYGYALGYSETPEDGH